MTVFDPSSTTNKYQPTAHSRIDFNLLIHFGFIFLFAVALQIIWTGKSLAEDSSKFSAFPLEKPFPSEASELSKFSEFNINDRRAGYNLDKNKPHGWKGSPQVNLKKLKQIGSIRAYSEYESIVIDNIENREGSTVGDYIYVSFRDVKLEVGDLFTVLSKKRLIRHPVHMSGEREKIPFIERRPAEAHNDLDTPLGVIMGNIVEVIGLIQIVEVGEKHSKAIVKESYWEVKPGDVLAPYHDPEYPDTRNETQSFPTKEGYLLAFKNEKDAAGYGDLAYIDMGKNDNVVPGDFFEIFTTPTHTIKAKWPQFRDRKIPMMRHLIGELQVVKVESETATVIVVKSFNQLRPGNEIKYKPREVPVLLAKMKKLHGAPNYGISDSEKARLLGEESVQDRADRSADANRGFPEAEILDEDNSPFGWAGQEDDGKGSKMLTFRPTKHLTDIHFTFDQYDLDDASKKILRNNADYLKENPEVKVQIQGHTDDRGTNNYNLALGARRTSSIKNYLVSLGVEEDRMYVISFGEEQPFCLEAVEACRYQNRRAHFMIAIEEKDQF